MLQRVWRDQRGFVASTDLILLATIVGLGMIVGLVALRNQVVQEFGDVATAIGKLNQSYTYAGDNDADSDGEADEEGCFVAGSTYTDQPDFGDGDDVAGQEPPGIWVNLGDGPPVREGEPLPGPPAP